MKHDETNFKTLDEVLAKRTVDDRAKIIADGDKLAEKRDEAKTKQVMKLFIDTEFTHLHKASSRLISIGLIAADGREFYAELPRHTWIAKASAFVLETVEPILWLGTYTMTPVELSDRLREWLRQFDSVEIVTDSPDWDFWFLCLIFEVDKEAGWPANVSRKSLRFDPECAETHNAKDRAAKEAFNWYWTDKTHTRHHALHDAKALRLAWLARHRGRPAE